MYNRVWALKIPSFEGSGYLENKLFGENFRASSPLWPSDRAQLLAMPDPWMLGIFLLGIGHDDTMEHTNQHFLEDFSLAHTSWGPRFVVASCRFKI